MNEMYRYVKSALTADDLDGFFNLSDDELLAPLSAEALELDIRAFAEAKGWEYDEAREYIMERVELC